MKKILSQSLLTSLLSLSHLTAADIPLNLEHDSRQDLRNSRSLASQQTAILAIIPEEINSKINLNPNHDAAHINAAKFIKTGLMMQVALHKQPESDIAENLKNCINLCFYHAWQSLDYAKNHLPTADYFIDKIRHLIPEILIKNIPFDIILSSYISPRDPPLELAAKFVKLGYIIRRIDNSDSRHMKEIFAPYCFRNAGKILEKLQETENFKDSSSAEEQEQVATLNKQYYELAVAHFKNEQVINNLQNKIEKLNKKIELAQHRQLFGTMQSGVSSRRGHFDVDTSPKSSPSMKALLDQVKSGNYLASAEDQLHENLIKTGESSRHLFPESAQKLPLDFLGAVGLFPHDSPYRQAFKFAKLGLNLIYDKTQISKDHQVTTDNHDQIITDCFESAGKSLSTAIELVKKYVGKPFAPETLMDAAMTGGQYYTWATQHALPEQRSSLTQSANQFYLMAIDAILDIPEENYDWVGVINDKTLREVILLNLEKIISPSQI